MTASTPLHRLIVVLLLLSYAAVLPLQAVHAVEMASEPHASADMAIPAGHPCEACAEHSPDGSCALGVCTTPAALAAGPLTVGIGGAATPVQTRAGLLTWTLAPEPYPPKIPR